MSGEISALIVEPGKLPRMERIRNNREAFEHMVGGAYGVAVFQDRETVLVYGVGGERRLAAPSDIARGLNHYDAGTYFLCGLDGTGFCSLRPSQQRYFAGLCGENPPIIILDSGAGQKTACTTVGDLAKAACCLWEQLKAGETVRMARFGKAGTRYEVRC